MRQDNHVLIGRQKMKCTEMLWSFCPKYNNAHVELAPASSCDFLLRSFLWVIHVRFYVFCHSIVPTNTWVTGPAITLKLAIFLTHILRLNVSLFHCGMTCHHLPPDQLWTTKTQLQYHYNRLINSQMQYQSFNQGVTVPLPSPFPPKFILCIIDHIFI